MTSDDCGCHVEIDDDQPEPRVIVCEQHQTERQRTLEAIRKTPRLRAHPRLPRVFKLRLPDELLHDEIAGTMSKVHGPMWVEIERK